MKRTWLLLIFLIILMMGCTGYAQPILSNMTLSQSANARWQISVESSEGGTLAMQMRSHADGSGINLGAVQVEAGQTRITWDGVLADNTVPTAGTYDLILRVRNFWGEESEPVSQMLEIGAEDAQREVLDLTQLDGVEEVLSWDEMLALADDASAEAATITEPVAPDTAVLDAGEPTDPNAVPVATSFWDMDPDAYDLTNPAHQQAIWDLMMQPITVLNVDQTDHVYPTNQPGINRTPYEQNTAGELHGQSQGVNILEQDTDGDGYVLIEAYSNDGTKTKDSYMMSIDNKRIKGYVKSSLLMTKKPSRKYALLIDKLRQKLYIFEAGRIIGDLDVSTGLNNDKQPYNESPAGEFLTVSRVGEFVSGTMRALYAIRINGGTLLHEVPYRFGADGTTRIYNEFEPELGKKASHGCIRIQRRQNAQGQNMQWLWNNLEMNTKVFVWDDQGRKMYDPELPAADLQLYRNPNGGSNYHLDPNCSGVKAKFLPLTGDLTYGDLMTDTYKKLTPCVYCGAPQRPETLYDRYMAEAKQLGLTLNESEVKKAFGIE